MLLYQRVLQGLLLVSGSFLILAFAAVLLPVQTMASCHRWLGLGEFPDSPITLYLARSTSLLYGVHGVMMFYTALTIKRHWRLVWLFGYLHIVTGCAMFVIDWTAPMPMYWILAEGLPVAGLGVVFLFLAQRAYGNRAEPGQVD